MANKSTFKAPQPPPFDSNTRDILKVKNWLVKMEQYLHSGNILKGTNNDHKNNHQASVAAALYLTDNGLLGYTSLKMRDNSNIS
ncbi:hypothetical protein HDV00_012611 [Rhizophlyctis rosea]|nr:hypothetical protein HDV00_012611 [Rhizophlyctis rosea]